MPIARLVFAQKTKNYWAAGTEIIRETLWPTRCVICDKPGLLLCEKCRLNLPYIDHWRTCKRCGGPQGSIQCSECNPIILKQLEKTQLPFKACVSVVSFDASTARLTTSFKDKNEQRLSFVMAQLLNETIPPAWHQLPQQPVITFIPATRKAFCRRGFDHADLLSEQVALLTGFTRKALFTRPKSKDQRDLTRKARISNMANRFTVLKAHPPHTVLLIDDVYTTGSTLCAASDALIKAGTKHVYCATFARVW